jgi:threonine synthase
MSSRLTHLRCARCSRAYEPDRLQNRCECGGTLLADYDSSGIDLAAVRARPPGLWRYRELLPVRGSPVVLGELQTPLLFAPRLAARWGTEVYVKDDSMLPGGTFKARGAAVGISRALELGARRLVMPSAGNAGGAWSLYAARAGVPITVTMAKDAPRMNQVEVTLAGGELELVDGTIADAGAEAKRIAATTGAFLCSTFSEPYRLEGKKTAWFEICDQLGDGTAMALPGTVVVPVGGGVAAAAAWKATAELLAAGWATGRAPRIIGVQPDTCAPIVTAFEAGESEAAPWNEPIATAAAGLRVPSPSEGYLVLNAVRETNGRMVAVSEDEIRRATALLASSEGVWACPEGACAVAAMERLATGGDLEPPVVVYNSGAGAKYAGEP